MDVKSEQRGIDVGVVSPDHSVLLELPHAVPARSFREAGNLPELCVGLSPRLFQRCYELQVDFIHSF